MKDQFVIAQISDLHIKAHGKLSYKKVDTLQAFKNCIAYLNQLSPQPDLVAITGDLTDFGRSDEYQTFSEAIASLKLPWVAIAGNHDDRHNLRTACQNQPWLPAESEFFHWSLNDSPLHIIGLDSTAPEKPWGEFCEKRQQWLDHALSQHPQKPTVVMLHHHPFISGIGHMDAQNLRGIERLESTLKKHPQVQRVLCGHLHRFITTTLAGITVCSAPGTSHQVAADFNVNAPAHFSLEPAGMLLHRWHAEQGFTTHYLNIGNYGPTHPFYDANGLID
ncbi:phosphodiesterase [Acinetobacter rathckeae]|uniref:phosphodiesterase n=1 Tax=Acinetobacter rathckeae TaxID=2605272 RepID=UPI0018A24C4C|nr:phosphodiesterase [Acinetobacter rathckeae]MBF7687203.1 phosphodiesterase [Acinetobacter rathckeae]MBF7694444.1 phosphodiesterase [Acinetobacter rathckeae]